MSKVAKVKDVFAAAVARLETITAGDTYLTSPTVQTAKYDQDAIETPQLLVRIDGWAEDENSPLGSTQLEIRLHIGVVCQQSQTTTDPLADLPLTVAADVEKALLSGVESGNCLGGKADGIAFNSADNLDLEAEGLSGLLMQFTITARYDYGQPEN